MIDYLCVAAAFEGGLVLLESAEAPDAADGREIRGASLWGLPPAAPCTEPWWHAQMRVMRFVPLRVLVLGGTVAAGKSFWFDTDALDFESFLAGFEAFVKAEVRCGILVLKEFSPGRDDGPMRSMAEAGFIAQMCYDRSRLVLPPDGSAAPSSSAW